MYLNNSPRPVSLQSILDDVKSLRDALAETTQEALDATGSPIVADRMQRQIGAKANALRRKLAETDDMMDVPQRKYALLEQLYKKLGNFIVPWPNTRDYLYWLDAFDEVLIGCRCETRPRRLTFYPGAYSFANAEESLSGKPLEVLQALDAANHNTATLIELQMKIWSETNSGEEAVRSAVSKARGSLRRVLRKAGFKRPCDPIPVVDRGPKRTAWRLELP